MYALFFPTALLSESACISICTCPDISYTIHELACFMLNYREGHIFPLKHLLHYLQGTHSYGLALGQKDTPYPLFHTLSDSD